MGGFGGTGGCVGGAVRVSCGGCVGTAAYSAACGGAVYFGYQRTVIAAGGGIAGFGAASITGAASGGVWA
jgi:hypothetical protein